MTPHHTLLVGEVIREAISASDPDGDPISFRVIDNPGFVSIEDSSQQDGTATATLVIAPTVNNTGTFQATLRAADSHGDADSATCTIDVMPPAVDSVTVSPASATVSAGATVQLTATPLDAQGNALSGRTVTWSSSDPSAATVDTAGLVTGAAEGSVTITATSEGKSGTAAITVTATPVATVVVTPDNATINVDETVQLSAITLDADGDTLSGRSVTWSSSAESVATVDADGLVTGVAASSATITATSEGKSGTASITVIGSQTTNLYLRIDPDLRMEGGLYFSTEPQPSAWVVIYTGSQTWEAFVDSDLTGSTYTFSLWLGLDGPGSKNFAVTLTARRRGSEITLADTTLTTTANDACERVSVTVSGESGALAGDKLLLRIAELGGYAGMVCMEPSSDSYIEVPGTVNATQVTVDTVVVSPATATIEERETLDLTATSLDVIGDTLTGRDIIWSSSDAAVATVDDEGLVKGEHEGVATVTAASDGKSGTAGITVTPLPLDSMKWSFSTGGPVRSCPAIASDGTLYFGSHDGYLYAVYPDGSKKWEYFVGDTVTGSPAIAPDGTVYVGVYRGRYYGRLYAINSDGTKKWEAVAIGEVTTSPALASDGTIYFGAGTGSVYRFYAINPDGSERWNIATYSYPTSPVIAADGTVYFGASNHLYALNPDGSEKWQTYTGGTYSSGAIGSDGTLYIGISGYSPSFQAINPDGTEKWHINGTPVYTSPAIGADGTIYVADSRWNLYALDASGNLIWDFDIGGTRNSSPAVGADGTIYVGADKELWAINPDGTRHSWFETGEFDNHYFASPTIGPDGTVYVGSRNFQALYAIYGDSGGLAVTPWPKLHHDLKNTGRVGGS